MTYITVNEDEGLSESDIPRTVFELGIKPPVRTQTICGEDILAKSRKFGIREGGLNQRGGAHQKVLKMNDYKHWIFHTMQPKRNQEHVNTREAIRKQHAIDLPYNSRCLNSWQEFSSCMIYQSTTNLSTL